MSFVTVSKTGSSILKALGAAALLSAITGSTLLLSGCAAITESGTTTSGIDSPAASIHGTVNGGYFPVYNATVNLYATGTGGYGVGSTLLATTTSATDGTWGFTKLPGTGTSAGTTSTWICPTSGNPQIYITSVGGNTQGTGTTATNNASAALIADIGLCSTISSSTQVTLNELTTVATVYAMAQYINPGTTPGAEIIGTSGTTQGTTGINNAAAQIANFVNIATGAAVTSTPYAGTASTVSSVTVTATPNSAKLISLANILVSCINNASNSNNNCTDLFNNAIAPSVSVTSQSSPSFGTASDTIQAAYYMATNPDSSNATTSSCNNTAGTVTRVACLFGLTSGTPPFQTGLSSTPTDWTLGVTYTVSGNCLDTAPFIKGPYHAAVDASGNLWFMNGASTANNLSEISPLGQPLYCGGNLTNGRGVTIDVYGNVWASFNGSTSANNILEVEPNYTTQNWSVTGTANAVQPYTVTADGFGNVFMGVNQVSSTGAFLYEWVNPNTSAPFAPTSLSGPFNSTTTTTLGYLQVDPVGRVWVTSQTSTAKDIFQVYPKPANELSITGVAVASGTVTFTATNSLSNGNVVQVFGLTSGNGTQFNYQTFTVTAATGTTFSAATAASNFSQTTDSGTGIIPGSSSNYSFLASANTDTGYGMAIDSSNNLYQGTTCCSGSTLRELTKWKPSTTLGVAPGTFNSVTNYGGINGVRSVAVDGASNVWVGNELPTTPLSNGSSSPTAGSNALMEYTSNTTAFTFLSPPGTSPTTCSTTNGCGTNGGYNDSNMLWNNDIEIDPSGNVWALNTGTGAGPTITGTSITELVGAAVPVATPFALALKNNQFNTKP